MKKVLIISGLVLGLIFAIQFNANAGQLLEIEATQIQSIHISAYGASSPHDEVTYANKACVTILLNEPVFEHVLYVRVYVPTTSDAIQLAQSLKSASLIDVFYSETELNSVRDSESNTLSGIEFNFGI